jgi:NADH:ubiquinone oxidoreductase subunit 6 (subunit J)
LSFCLLSFFNIEFLAIISPIIYIGAIAVSFSFIIMMLNSRIINFNINFYNYIPFYKHFFFLFLLFFYYYFLEFNTNYYINFSIKYWDWTILIYSFINIKIIGLLLYNYFFNLIIFIAFLLFFVSLFIIFSIFEFEKKKKIKILDNIENNIIINF